jgi:hypothetical protein
MFHCLLACWKELLFPSRGKSSHWASRYERTVSIRFWHSLLPGVQIRCLQNSGSLLRRASGPGDCGRKYSCAATDNKTHRIILCRERPRAMMGVIGVRSDMCVSVEVFGLPMMYTME